MIGNSVHRFLERTFILGSIPHRLILMAKQAVADSRFALHSMGKFRRFWIVHFRKQYVQKQLIARKGDCRRCGTCCNLLYICPMLTTAGKCAVYGFCRPQVCKVFPIDQRDIEEVYLSGNRCGYYFR